MNGRHHRREPENPVPAVMDGLRDRYGTLGDTDSDLTQVFSHQFHEGQVALRQRTSVSHLYDQLDPYATVDDGYTEPTAVYTVPPRMEDVGIALAMLAGKVRVWEARSQARNLGQYLAARVWTTGDGLREGDTPGYNPLAGLRQYREFHDEVVDAAHVLRSGGA